MTYSVLLLGINRDEQGLIGINRDYSGLQLPTFQAPNQESNPKHKKPRTTEKHVDLGLNLNASDIHVCMFRLIPAFFREQVHYSGF